MYAFLKSLSLRHYCGFKDLHLDFTDGDKIKNLALLFAPNGSGKSTVLNVINLLAFPWQFEGRDVDLLFRKLTFHPDYNPSYAGYETIKGMRAEAVFLIDGEEKRVVIENTDDKVGIVTCELERRSTFMPYAIFVDADNPMNNIRFQLDSTYKERFLEVAEAIYGFECEILAGDLYDVEEYDAQRKEHVTFHTDFMIHKSNGTRVHFKSMSAGEKKVATLLSTLLSPLYYDNYDVFLIDNFSLHVYWRRHITMLEKLLSFFSNKQLIITDHSGTLIQYVEQTYPQYVYDLEKL